MAWDENKGSCAQTVALLRVVSVGIYVRIYKKIYQNKSAETFVYVLMLMFLCFLWIYTVLEIEVGTKNFVLCRYYYYIFM